MYYKGNNIGLNYDAATGTWSFENTPNDFMDTEAFSSQDPKFDYVPPESTTPDEPDEDPCPAGYIYDSTLKQCVLDPNYQNPFANANQSGGGQDTTPQRIAGTNRTTTDNNFIATDDEYSNMSSSELVENYKQRGFIKKNDKGELVIDFNRVKRKGGILDSLLGRMGQPQVEGMASLNKVIDYLTQDREGGPILTKAEIYGTTAAGQTQFNNEVVIPTIAKFEADYYGIPYSDVIAPGFGDSIFGTKESVQKFDDYMSKKLEAFATVANNTISNYNPDTAFTGSYSDNILQNRLDKEKERKAKFDADIAQIKADKEKIKAERDMQKLIKEAEEREKLKNELDDMIPKGDDKDKDTSGDDTGGGSNIVQGPNPGDAGGTSTYSSGSSSPSTGQSVGPVGAPVSVTIPRGPDLTNR